MNFGKLLGAGKSFVNGGKAAAYRADKRVYLPKFVSPKNPFAESDETATAEPPKPAAEIRHDTAVKIHVQAKTQKMPAVSADADARRQSGRKN